MSPTTQLPASLLYVWPPFDPTWDPGEPWQGGGRPGQTPRQSAVIYQRIINDRWADVAGLFACDPYWVVLRLERGSSGLFLSSVEVKAYATEGPPAQDPPRIDVTNTLRRLPLPRMVAELKREYTDLTRRSLDHFRSGPNITVVDPDGFWRPLSESEKDEWVAEQLTEYTGAENPFTKGRKGYRGAYGLEHYEQVAKVYNDAIDRGEPPTSTVARKFHVAKSTAAKWVRTCRTKYGLLPPTQRGVARSTPTTAPPARGNTL